MVVWVLLKIDFHLKQTLIYIHVYVIATTYLWNNTIVEYIDNLKTIAALSILTPKFNIMRAPVKECSAFWINC